MGDGSFTSQSLEMPATTTPSMIGAIFRKCLPVVLKPTIVKIPPMVGPLRSPSTSRTRIVANNPLTAMLNTVAGPPSSTR